MNRNLDAYLFDEVLNPSEKVLWVGRPSRLTYAMGGLPMLIFGLVWGLFDLFVLVTAIMSDGLQLPIILFLSIHAFPLYLGIGGLVRRLVEYRNVYYASTDKRLIIRNGFMGADYEMVEYSRMRHMRVKTNPIEHLQGRGSIMISTGDHQVSKNGLSTRHVRLQGIENPYEVLKELQQAVSEATEINNNKEKDKGYYKEYEEYRRKTY